MDINELKKALGDTVCNIEFNKSDGTLRKMRATRMSAYIPADKAPKNEPNEERVLKVVPVFDLDLMEWRSIKPASVTKMESV